MKQIILLLFVTLSSFSCSTDNASDCAEIEKQYLEALGYTGGSPAAIERIKEQYAEKKTKRQ